MLLEHEKGDFCGASGQALADGSAASTNVLNYGAVRHSMGMAPLYIWLTTRVIETGADNDTYYCIFQQDSAEGFGDGPLEVFRIQMTGDDARLQTAGAIIWSTTMPSQIYQQYVRWYFTCANVGGTAAVTLNAGYGPDRPHEERNRSQVYDSNVGNP